MTAVWFVLDILLSSYFQIKAMPETWLVISVTDIFSCSFLEVLSLLVMDVSPVDFYSEVKKFLSFLWPALS